MTLPLEQLEGKYEILSKIQEGGMGAVYRVRHLLLDEIRVIKVIRPQFAGDEGLQQRFLHEARTAIRLRHPNVAQLYDFAADEVDGSSYMVMEYIDGVTLKQLLHRAGPPSTPLAAEIAHQGLSAVSYLHHHGYVHRDIAPDNLMLSRDFRGRPLVKLIDLGIVKRLGADAGLTQTGMFLGKVRYASPEQLDSSVIRGEPDHRSDLYSYGVLLYELLTGRCPFPGESFSELVAAHLLKPPLEFSETDPSGRVPPELRRLVLATLEKRRADRIASADELIAALAPFRVPADALRQEVEAALAAAALAAETEPAEPGSTQSRLDRQFRQESTPTPATPAPAAGSPAERSGPRETGPAAGRPRALRPAAAAAGERGPQEGLAAPAPAASAPAPSLADAELELEETLATGRSARRRRSAGPDPAGEGGARPRPRRRLGRWLAAAAGVALLAAGAVWVLDVGWAGRATGAPQDPGSAVAGGAASTGGSAGVVPAAGGILVLDALPWAEVLAITDAAGQARPAGPDPYTPLRLALPAGLYTLSLTHPRLAQPRQIAVAVRAGETTREIVRLAPADADAYIDQAMRPTPSD